MTHSISLTENVPFGDSECRLLELRADTLADLLALRIRARKKLWFDWLGPLQLKTGQWGSVLEKGMPDSVHFSDAVGELAFSAENFDVDSPFGDE